MNLTADEIKDFQDLIDEAAHDPKARLNYIWPYFHPGMEAYLPASVSFVGWEDNEVMPDGMRCARLRKTGA